MDAHPEEITPPPPTTPRRPWPRLQLLLLLLTAATTFAAGAVGWQPEVLGLEEGFGGRVAEHWRRGIAYMAAVLAVLGAHEAGHYVAARVHGIPATLPFFIPMPVLLTGTLGAVIGMEGSRANRRQLFDIALAGPLAGLAVAVPVLVAGLVLGEPVRRSPFSLPPLASGLLALVRPDIAAGGTIAPNALFMAGWVGLLVTGLNMVPVSQLDGGHVSYAVLGHRAHWLARGILVAAIATIVILGRVNWVAMVVIVTLLGTDHPPIASDGRPLGPVRTILGVASFLIPLVTFMPEPLRLG